jgi:uncharacterized membrane protein YdjX (TVP38/TMEM64 family)
LIVGRTGDTGGMRNLLIYGLLGALFIAAIFVAGEDLKQHIDAVDAWVAGLGGAALLGFVVLFIIGTSVFVPESLFGVMAGALFGIRTGILIAMLANALAASLQYYMARSFLRPRVRRAVETRQSLKATSEVVAQGGFKLHALVRLTPLNPAVVNYVLGASGVRFVPFLLACVAILPHVFAEVYVGVVGKRAAHVAAGGLRVGLHPQELLLAVGLVATLVVLVIASRWAQRIIKRMEGSR